MLYDPKWQVKADPLALTSVIAWLETQVPTAQFSWSDCDGRCLFSRYLASHGFDPNPENRATFPTWDKLHNLYGAIIFAGSFGGALARAKNLAAGA